MRSIVYAGLLAIGLALPGASASLAAPATGIPNINQMTTDSLTLDVQRRSTRVCRRSCDRVHRRASARIKSCTRTCRHR